jgi:hypothetical protein
MPPVNEVKFFPLYNQAVAFLDRLEKWSSVEISRCIIKREQLSTEGGRRPDGKKRKIRMAAPLERQHVAIFHLI